jgi:hypothetical protein
MGSFYTPDLNYDLNTFLDNLGTYSLTNESFGTLDQARELVESRKYYFLGVPFPKSTQCNIAGYNSFSGIAAVPPLSYLVALTGDSFYTTTVEEVHTKMQRAKEGFSFKMYDKGASLDVSINTLFANNFPNVGLMGSIVNPSVQTNRPIGPMFMEAPMIVLEPGALQIEITNLSQYPVYIQMMLLMCCPINRQSSNEVLALSGANAR